MQKYVFDQQSKKINLSSIHDFLVFGYHSYDLIYLINQTYVKRKFLKYDLFKRDL